MIVFFTDAFDVQFHKNPFALFEDQYNDYNKISNTGKNVIAIVTAGDEKGTVPRWANRVGLIFKHQFDPTQRGNCYHIPLPYVNGFAGNSSIPMEKRKWDAFFIGRSLKHRQHAKKALLEFKKKTDLNVYIEFTDGFMKGLKTPEYSKIMSNTKFAISLHGAKRPECLRFSEAVKCGCAIIACDHPMNRAFKNCPATYVDNHSGWGEIENIIESFTPEKLQQTSDSMKQCYEDYFSPEAVGKYITKVTRSQP